MPWGEEDRLTPSMQIWAEVDRLKAELALKREYIQVLHDEVAELRDLLVDYRGHDLDPDHDYVHESAQEAYDNEQRDGNDV